MPDINTVVVTPTVSVVAVNSSVPGSYESVGRLSFRQFLPEEYGAEGDGTTDDTTAIQRAIDAAALVNGIVYFTPGKTYRCLSLAVSDATNVTFVGYGATLKKLGGGASTHILDVTGTLGSSTLLTADVAEGAATVALTSAASFPAGTYVLLRDDTYAYATTGRNQELTQIESVASLTATLERSTIRSYATASNATALVLTPTVNFRCFGLTFEVPTGTNNGGCVQCDLVYGATFRDCTFLGMNDDPGLYVTRSYHVWAESCEWRDGQNTGTGGYGYGAAFFESSHHGGVRGGSTTNIRESLMSDGVRYITFDGLLCIDNADASINTHGSGVRWATIRGCTVTGGQGHGIAVGQSNPWAGDEDVDVIDCDVEVAGDTGISVSSATGKENTNVRVIGCRVRRPSNVTAAEVGIGVSYTTGFEVRGCVVIGETSNPATAIRCTNATDGAVTGNTVMDFPGAYGIVVSDCTDVDVRGNIARDVSSNNYRSTGTNTRVRFLGNYADDTSATIQAGDVFADNDLGNTTIGASGDRGDASVTLTWGASYPTQRFDTTLTQNRTITLSTTNATRGARFRVVRTGLGAFTLDVGGLKTIPSATAAFVDVEFNGSAWQLAGYGTL